ncbi:hypothetical protein ACEWB4_15465 [Sphingobium sp. sgz301303]
MDPGSALAQQAPCPFAQPFDGGGVDIGGAAEQAQRHRHRPVEAQRGAERVECEAAETSVRNAKLVAMVRERTANFRSETYPALLGKVARLATPPAPPAPPATEQPQPGESKGREAPAAGITPQPAPAPSPVEYVSTANLKVSFASPYLASEADVETYLQAYRETLLAEIRSGKRITV